MFNTEPKPLQAVLIGLTLPGHTPEETEQHLTELEALAETQDIKTLTRFSQRLSRPYISTWIGSGKVEEIGAFIQANEVDIALFDDDLSPRQVANLESAWRCHIWDRSLLILNIFAMRARTSQAKIQVELARSQYLLPRLTGMWRHLTHQKGGTAMKGPGEKELETDRRILQGQIHTLKKRLERVEQQNATRRQERKKNVNVALVGYTNAGKSSLMRCLSKAQVAVEDKLFATLTTTVRKVVLQEIPFFLADTVGFIRKLPHTLIESFKATLAEVREADLLLHVVDFSHPECQTHIQVVCDTLREINAAHIPQILVFNKIDNLPAPSQVTPEVEQENLFSLDTFLRHEQARYQETYHHPVVLCSVLYKEGIEELRRCLYEQVRTLHYKIYPFSLANAQTETQ